ncbi:hypothetical protein [Streptomyces barkulensis]|uniref:hypothetical protein n=1 Tax=Streptomyces barkulensis TaxID=1257026 RepID=UPI00117D7599|nr:hypothetical protein [Streptomyces barkulensis]
MRRSAAILIAAGVALGGLALPAQAAGQQDAQKLSKSERAAKAAERLARTDNKVVRASLKKENKEWKVSSKEFKEARAKARNVRARSGLTGEDLKKVQEFTRQAAERGNTYRSEEVEVIPLLDGDVEAILPKGTVIDSLGVEVSDGAVTLESETSNPDVALAEYAGPGMADWVNNGSGQYILRVPGMGEGHFTWKRNKLSDDGSGTYDWYQYSRFGVAKPANINDYPDPYVQLIRVQSYPYDGIESGLVTWEDIAPRTSFEGDCNADNLSLSVTSPVGGFGYTFNDCDTYEVWYNSSNPGSQWIEMDQGLILWNGGRDYEAAYTNSFKVKQGTAGSMHDFQRVTFVDGASDLEGSCDSYDVSETC